LANPADWPVRCNRGEPAEEGPYDRPAVKELTVEYGDETGGNAHEGTSKNASLLVILATEKGNVVHPLLLHAKLYAFAHMYLIEPFKVSAKQKMIDQLKKIDNLAGGNERAAVFDVLDYMLSKFPEEDLLIHWLARYANWRLEELGQMPTRFDGLISGENSTPAKILLRCVFKSPINPFNLEDEQILPR
jgi:hypothetical protein